MPAETATIRLNHYCNIPEALGGPGDVIEVPAEIAEKLISRKGAVLVRKSSPPPLAPTKKTARKKEDGET
jgi:hypothetical protein